MIRSIPKDLKIREQRTQIKFSSYFSVQNSYFFHFRLLMDFQNIVKIFMEWLQKDMNSEKKNLCVKNAQSVLLEAQCSKIRQKVQFWEFAHFLNFIHQSSP